MTPISRIVLSISPDDEAITNTPENCSLLCDFTEAFGVSQGMEQVSAAYPRSDIQFSKHLKLAEVCEIFNAEFSVLHRLPPEVLLDISDRLDAADQFSLRLTCRRYRKLLHTTLKDPTINTVARNEV